MNMPASERDWRGRTIFLAYQIAGGSPQYQIEDALGMLEATQPGYFEEVLRSAKDMKGLVLEPVVCQQAGEGA
jgi:hypothetical protein